jgi:ferredoxin
MEQGRTLLSIIEGRCIGAGNCAEQAEDYFEQNDDDAKISLLKTEVEVGDIVRVQRAVNVCPVSALALH